MGGRLLISETAAADKLAVCSGLVVFDSEKNRNDLKLFICPTYLQVPIPGLLIAVAPRYRYCSGATFTLAVAVAPLLLAESSGDCSAATFLSAFSAIRYRYF